MKKAFVDILIGAVTITAAVYLLNKFFTESAAQATAAKDNTTDDAPKLAIVEECIFPPEMNVTMDPHEVNNWGTLTKQSYLNHEPDDQ